MATGLSPLTPRMLDVLRVLAAASLDEQADGLTADRIASRIDGLEPVRRHGNGAVRGSWSGTASAALRINGALTSLRARGLIYHWWEPGRATRNAILPAGLTALEASEQ